MISICYLPAGRSVLAKTVPEVLSTARGRRPRAVPKTESTVFPNTDRQITCLLFSSVEYFVSSFCVEFSLQPFSKPSYYFGSKLTNYETTRFPDRSAGKRSHLKDVYLC